MRSTCKAILVALLVLSWAGCDSTSKPEPADCELVAGSIIYEDGKLVVDVTATVTDSSGNSVEKVLINLESDRESDSFDPAVGTTDASGQVVFQVSTQEGGTATLQASRMDAEVILGQPVEVEFGLQLLLIADDVQLAYPGASVALSAQVSDDVGSVEGATLVVTSDRGGSDTIDPASQPSASDGTASFEVTTMEEGTAIFTLEVEGLTLSDPATETVVFGGTTLVGNWSFPQPGGEVTAPRIGLFWIEFGQESFPDQELASVAIEPVPLWGVTGSYSIQLPMQAPREDLYHPDPEDPDLPASFRIAPYLIFAYDDLDGSGEFSYMDLLLTAFTADSMSFLVWVEGEMPDPLVIPDAAPGYHFMTMIEGQEDPLITPWDQQTDEADVSIRAAPCFSGPTSGQVSFGSTLDASSDTRVALFQVDANLMGQSGFNEIFNDGNFLELVSVDVACAPNATQDYELTYPDPADVDPAYTDFLAAMDPQGLIKVGMMFPLVYIDADGDDIFTNADNDVYTGDLIIGLSAMPFGYGMSMVWWFDSPMNLQLSSWLPGVNQGYNLLHEPLKREITDVVDDTTLELDEVVEPGHTGLPFRIVRQIGDEDVVVLTGDDLATGDIAGRLVTSASGGFTANVQPTDQLVFLNQIQNTQILDLDTPSNLATP